MTMTELYNIAGFIGGAVLFDNSLQAASIQFFGKRLRVYIGGVDTFNQTDPADRYPYFVVSPLGTETVNGSRTSTIHAQLAIRADHYGDSTKPIYRNPESASEDYCLNVGAYVELCELADKIEDTIRNADVGAVIDSVNVELDLENQYPLQVADMTIVLTDLESF